LYDIHKGDRFEDLIREELPRCNELIALLTPWSIERNWVWTEIAAAWITKKPFVGILYGLTLKEIEVEHGGAACLSSTTVATIDEFDTYLAQLRIRIEKQGQGR
jgi:hypothetical protein